MGIYNEVYKKCPKCAHPCKTDVGQIEIRFRVYDLDNRYTTEHLSRLQKEELADFANNEDFLCACCGLLFKVQVVVGVPNPTQVYV